MTSRFTFLLIGIAIGILIAPDKGSVTRQRLSTLIDDLSETGQHLTEDLNSPKMSADLS
jgi:hypothetical protein